MAKKCAVRVLGWLLRGFFDFIGNFLRRLCVFVIDGGPEGGGATAARVYLGKGIGNEAYRLGSQRLSESRGPGCRCGRRWKQCQSSGGGLDRIKDRPTFAIVGEDAGSGLTDPLVASGVVEVPMGVSGKWLKSAN
jgi:hypothetical protein